ncbi:hypothetical protein BACUNI_03057 [Bacteroides uniformis ATCC 8492]|uniref:Uncharacterized protein n=1 Tax=Bacteroides uniformis (strain ATCC 8492 / DSM 6597 / CCUG 4942 / CIP 103695 / JCM 5828 / KCTC 5204 / NCTC 13054 / VPI 0061) TaxID=411479 RepID=A0ABC9N949_BACUC|nr:hypothetical protein BACUNI_03057 [Bacteroides uniformis ATCC 8492]
MFHTLKQFVSLLGTTCFLIENTLFYRYETKCSIL